MSGPGILGFFFTLPEDLETINPVNKINYSSFLSFQAMTLLNILFVSFDTNLLEDTIHGFLKVTIINKIWNANNLQCVSSGMFSQHCVSVLTTLCTSLSLTVLTSAMSASNYLK